MRVISWVLAIIAVLAYNVTKGPGPVSLGQALFSGLIMTVVYGVTSLVLYNLTKKKKEKEEQY